MLTVVVYAESGRTERMVFVRLRQSTCLSLSVIILLSISHLFMIFSRVLTTFAVDCLPFIHQDGGALRVSLSCLLIGIFQKIFHAWLFSKCQKEERQTGGWQFEGRRRTNRYDDKQPVISGRIQLILWLLLVFITKLAIHPADFNYLLIPVYLPSAGVIALNIIAVVVLFSRHPGEIR